LVTHSIARKDGYHLGYM